MYTRPLGIIVQRYDAEYRLYSSATQLYIGSFLKNLVDCITDIWLWMTATLLNLNDDIANIVYLDSPVLKIDVYSLTSNGSINRVFSDKCVNMFEHVTSVC